MMLDGVKLDLSQGEDAGLSAIGARKTISRPANSVFKARNLFGGPVRFIMAGSGHIAGVINPPAAKKYQYWTNDARRPATIEDWRAGAIEHPGSWWPDWDAWLSKLSGKKIPARKPGDGKLKVLGDAPGELCARPGAIGLAPDQKTASIGPPGHELFIRLRPAGDKSPALPGRSATGRGAD